MANFKGMVVTKQGLALMTKLLVNDMPTVITHIAIGGGSPPEGENPEDIAALVLEHTKSSVLSKQMIGRNIIQLEARFKSTDFPAAVRLHEIGVFALDPDEGEILYAYDYATEGDYIPPDGGGTFVVRTFRVMIQVANSASVNFDVDGTVTIQNFYESGTPYTLSKAIEKFTSDAGQQEFTLSEVNASGVLSVFVEGAAYFDWTAEGQTVTLDDKIPEGREVVFVETVLAEGDD